jgi:hypothetical protein
MFMSSFYTKCDVWLKPKQTSNQAIEQIELIFFSFYSAVDECDFGTALELGIDLFCHGTKNLHDVLRPLLIAGYTMTQRPQYIAIMKVN